MELNLRFVDSDVCAVATCLTERAPLTCAAIWDLLAQPLDVVGIHAMYTGPELSLQVPPERGFDRLTQLPPENQTVFPLPGDLLWAYMPPFAWGGLPTPIFDLGVFYGRNARVFLPMGWVPCNHFASLKGDWADFGDMCRRTRLEGAMKLRIQRV